MRKISRISIFFTFYFVLIITSSANIYLIKTYSTSLSELYVNNGIHSDFFTETSISKFQSLSKDTWNITNIVIIKNQTLIVNRSIFIYSEGALVLKNATIKMDLSYRGEHWIEVYSGGNLTIIDSRITTLNTTNKYYIKVHSGSKFYMERSEISYAGYTWESNGVKSGLWINTSNVVMKKNKIHHNLCNLFIMNSCNSTIIDNTMSNSDVGMFIFYSDNNLVVNNTLIDNNFEGMLLYKSHNNTIFNNIITNSSRSDSYVIRDIDFPHIAIVGLYLAYAHNNKITHNSLTYNFIGLSIDFSYNNTIANNMCMNNTVGIDLNLSDDNCVDNNTIFNNEGGISLAESNNNIIFNNTIFFNSIGLGLEESYDNAICSNAILNGTYGIYMEYSYQNDITRNSIINNTCGICLFFSEQNNIANNTLASNNNLHNIYIIRRGLDSHKPTLPAGLNNKTFGILVCHSQNNKIVNNIISNCSHAIYLYDSYGNIIYRNTMLNNTFGIQADQPTLICSAITILISFTIVLVIVIVIKKRKLHK